MKEKRRVNQPGVRFLWQRLEILLCVPSFVISAVKNAETTKDTKVHEGKSPGIES